MSSSAATDKKNLSPAQRLIQLRERLGFSQRDLAREFQVSNGAIGLWEKNERPVPGPVLKLLDLYESENAKKERDLDPGIQEQLQELSRMMSSEEADLVFSHWKKHFTDHMSLNYIKGQILTKAIIQFLPIMRNSKGATLKLVQLMSFVEVGLPGEIRKTLGELAETSTPLSKHTIRKVIKKELGDTPENIFKKWSDTPLAVTSLAQIHRARLPSGEEVAVKVQNPDIEMILEKQFRNVEWLRRLTMFFKNSDTKLINEIKAKILEECDYIKEADNQRRFYNIFSKDSGILIPQVFAQFSTKRILTTEYISGLSFSEFQQTATQAKKNEAAKIIHRFGCTSLFGYGMMHSDMHPNNYLFQDEQVVFLDFGRVLEFGEERLQTEKIFLHALLHENHEVAKRMLVKMDSVEGLETFNYLELWSFLERQQIHYMRNGAFKFSRDHLVNLAQEGRRFSGRKSLKIDKWFFWAFFLQNTSMSVFAELNAELNWRVEVLTLLNRYLD